MSVEAGHTYIIVNVKSGTVLDLSGTDNHSILGWEEHGGDNQRWRLERENNQWTFRNVGNDKFLGLASRELKDGLPLRGVEHEFAWDIFPAENEENAYRISVPDTNFDVDLSNHGDANDGTLVTLWGKWAGKNQTWRFQQVD